MLIVNFTNIIIVPASI